MSAKKLLALLAALLLITAACGDDDDDDASSTTTSVSEEADAVSEEAAIGQLTYDGTACTYAGPAEVTAGSVAVEFVNTGDDNANIGVGLLEEGYTVDDLAEYVNDPANAAVGAPSWLGGPSIGVPRAEPGETTTWEADLEAGEYALLCERSVGGSPWNVAGAVIVGSGLTVVEG